MLELDCAEAIRGHERGRLADVGFEHRCRTSSGARTVAAAWGRGMKVAATLEPPVSLDINPDRKLSVVAATIGLDATSLLARFCACPGLLVNGA
jgi:hypothetical protein